MSTWGTQVWVAIIGTVGALAAVVGNRTGNKADAASKLTDGALAQVASMREDLTAERERGDRLESEIDELRREFRAEQRAEREWCDMRINQLVAAMHREGIEVPPPPPRPPLDL